MWAAAFPDHPITAELTQHQIHDEHLHGARIDELQLTLRHKITDPERQLGDVECPRPAPRQARALHVRGRRSFAGPR
jgi:hypothetical protein